MRSAEMSPKSSGKMLSGLIRLTSTKVMERSKCGERRDLLMSQKMSSSVKHGGGHGLGLHGCFWSGSLIFIDDVTHDGTLPGQKKLCCWNAFCFDYGAHLLWHCFDNLMQCHNIYFHPELH